MVVETGVKTARKGKQGRGLLMLKLRTNGFNILEKEFELANSACGRVKTCIFTLSWFRCPMKAAR